MKSVSNTYLKVNASSQWGIQLKESGKIIGVTGFISIEFDHERGEIAYIMSPLYSGRGLMTEANYAVLNYGFDDLGLNRVQAKAELTNISSQKVLEKLNFSKEGVFRDYLKIKGSLRTYAYYSILKNEFSKNVI